MGSVDWNHYNKLRDLNIKLQKKNEHLERELKQAIADRDSLQATIDERERS